MPYYRYRRTVPSTWAFHLLTGTRSDLGPRRSDNQDSGYASERLLLIADGVGGAPAGDFASALAVRSLAAAVETVELPNPAWLRDEIIRTNGLLAAAGRKDPSVRGMATTMTGLVLADDTAYLVHVGDSRAYRYRDGVLKQMSTDQSWVQMLLDEGMIDPAEAATHPMRNMLMHSLSGALRDPESVHITPVDLEVGDRWLLATDGLTSYLPLETIASQISSIANAQELAEVLVDLSWPRSLDNISVTIGDVTHSLPAQQGRFIGAAEGRQLRRSQAG